MDKDYKKFVEMIEKEAPQAIKDRVKDLLAG